MAEEKQMFPREKVLTISARDYIELSKSYKIRGVHGDTLDEFCRNVPEGTEMVVDYRFAPTEDFETCAGTALIPRQS